MESDSSAICSDTSIGKLKELLRLESKSHQDTGQCYDTLQNEYDDLLRKYAEAENTIDKLRIDTLRERIEKGQDEQGIAEVSNSNNVWKCLYDDLLCRTSKLQNAVTEFQAHLANHEYTGEELNDIFDRLHTDFENIANAFQSMQALGNHGVSPNEKYPEESIVADDLEGNLYRLGLRLEEIQDEISDQLRSTLKGVDDNGNDQNGVPCGVSNSRLTVLSGNIDLKKSLVDECSDTETNKRGDIESDDDVALELDDWRPVTDDLTEMMFYKKQKNEIFSGLDIKYLSRSFSEPHDLLKLKDKEDVPLTPNDFLEDLPQEEVEGPDFHATKNTSSNIDVNRRKRVSSKSPTVAIDKLNLKKSPPPPLQKLNTPVVPSGPNLLNSPEDSGYLEGSNPGQQDVTMRYPSSPLRNCEHESKTFDIRGTQDPVTQESTGEQYRQRLDSLRGYILAKRASNNSSCTNTLESMDRRPRTRGKKPVNLNHRNVPRSPPCMAQLNTLPKLNTSYKVTDPGSSTTESMFSSIVQHTYEELGINKRSDEEQKPAVQKKDIDTLKDEMQGVKDIVLDLKRSLDSQKGKQCLHQPPSRVSMSNHDLFHKPTTTNPELLQLQELQNKQLEILEKLEGKLNELSDKMVNTKLNQQQTVLRKDGGRHLDDFRKSEQQSGQSLHNDYDFYRIGEGETVEIPRNLKITKCKVKDDVKTLPEKYVTQQPSAGNGTEGLHSTSYTLNKRLNSRNGNPCNDTEVPHHNTVLHEELEAGRFSGVRFLVRNSIDNVGVTPGYNRINNYSNDFLHDQVNSNHPICGQNISSNQVGLNSNIRLKGSNTRSEESQYDGHRENIGLNNSVKSYQERFEAVGTQINKLTAAMQECHEKEEKKICDDTLEKQKMLVSNLEEKLDGLSTKIEENERKAKDMFEPMKSLVCVPSCQICGLVCAHQQGATVFNGQSIIGPANNMTSSYRTPNRESAPVNHFKANNKSRLGDADFIRSTNNVLPQSNVNGENVESVSPSPNVYHHYHTVCSPPKEECSRETDGRYANKADSYTRNSLVGNRLQGSLEKASLAALHMEKLSKKMLHGIANDLFNSGPSEF